MENQDFEQLIQTVKGKPIPNSPVNLEANVLRRIRLQQTTPSPSPQGWGWDFLCKPSVVAGVFTLVFLFSSAVTAVLAPDISRDEERKQLASSALDFKMIHQKSFFTFDEE